MIYINDIPIFVNLNVLFSHKIGHYFVTDIT